MDWNACNTIANFFVAFATFALACCAARQIFLMKKSLDLSRKELSLLKAQTDLYRQERELANRPNLFVRVFGAEFSQVLPDSIVCDRGRALYFLLSNMSERPIEYVSGFIFNWKPGDPLDIDLSQETGRVTSLNPLSGNSPALFAEPGGRLCLIPNEDDAVRGLFPERPGQETTFAVVLAVLYPQAPSGLAKVSIPIKIRRVDSVDGVFERRVYAGWPLVDLARVYFPVASGA